MGKQRFRKMCRQHKPKLILLMILLLISNMAMPFSYAFEASDISISLVQEKDVDVVLTLGETAQAVDTFESDLKDALVLKGLPQDLIDITSVEMNTTSTNDADAEVIFNSWENYPNTTGQWTFDRMDIDGRTDVGVMGSTQNVSFTGFWDSSETAQSTKDINIKYNSTEVLRVANYGLNYGGTTVYCHPDPQGFTFRMKKSDGTYSFYSFWIYAFQQSAGLFKVVDIPTSSLNYINDGLVNGPLRGWTSTTYPTVGEEGTYTKWLGFDEIDYDPREVHAVEIDVQGNHILISYDGAELFDVVDDDSPLLEGSYGPWTYSMPNGAFFDMQFTAVDSKTFEEALREPSWKDTSERFIVNLADTDIDGLNTGDADLPEILTRMDNEEIHYIGWGNDANEVQAVGVDGEGGFVAKNSGRGIFVNKDDLGRTYDGDIDAIADYIYDTWYASRETDVQYLTKGMSFELSVTPESEKTDTIDSDWLSGKWEVVHTPDIFENNTGAVSYSGQYLSDINVNFDKVGQYDISYKDAPVKTIYVHRKPISNFSFTLDAENALTLTDVSYDLDHLSQEGRGIAERVWEYKKAEDLAWTDGQPALLEADTEYIIRLWVQDEEGAWSVSQSKFATTAAAGSDLPIADFTIFSNPMYAYEGTDLMTVDASYDPSGERVAAYTWTVNDGTSDIYTNTSAVSTPMTDFSELDAGDYGITLVVENASGVQSKPFTRTLSIIKDTLAPSAVIDTTNMPTSAKLTFSDEGGSQIAYQRYALSSSTDPVDTLDYSTKSNGATRTALMRIPGSVYVHYEVEDNAGNRTTGYFGPYNIVDSSSPTRPSIRLKSGDAAYAPWLREDVSFSIYGATDDLYTVIYEYSTDAETWTSGSTGTLTQDGTSTIYYRAKDLSGNVSETQSTDVSIDKLSPTAPLLEMTSDGTTYVENTWVTEPVDFVLSGSTDLHNTVGYKYSTDGENWIDGASGRISTSGTTRLTYAAADSVGNVTSGASVNVLIDTTGPAIAIDTSDLPYGIDLNYSDADSGMAKQRYAVVCNTTSGSAVTVDDGDWMTFSSSEDQHVALGEDGLVGYAYVAYEGFDAVGNSVSGLAGPYTISDVLAPTTPDVLLESDGAPYSSGVWTKHDVSFELSNAIDGYGEVHYYYSFDAENWIEGSEGSITEPGLVTVYYKAVDDSGNSSAVNTFTVKLNKPEFIYYQNGDSQSHVTSSVNLLAEDLAENRIVWSTESSRVTLTTGSAFSIDQMPEVVSGSAIQCALFDFPVYDDEMVVLKAQVDGDADSVTYILNLIATQTDAQAVDYVMDRVDITYQGDDTAAHVTSDLLPYESTAYGTQVKWETSNSNLISVAGNVTQPSFEEGDQSVTLTATVSRGGYSESKAFKLTVIAVSPTDTQAVQKVLETLSIDYANGDSSDYVTRNLNYVFESSNDVQVAWSTDAEAFVSNTGIVSRPTHTEGDQTVGITAQVKRGDIVDEAVFRVTVKALPINDEEIIAELIKRLAIVYANGDNAGSVTQDIGFNPSENEYGAVVGWESDSKTYVTDTGGVTRPDVGQTERIVILTARIAMGDAEATVDFVIKVRPLKEPIIETSNDVTIDDVKIEDAIEGAKDNDEDEITIIVDEEVSTSNTIKVSIDEEKVKEIINAGIGIKLESGSVSVKVPMTSRIEDELESADGFNRLELVIEKLDAQNTDKYLREGLGDDSPVDIYNDHVYDFKMKVITEDASGNVVDEAEIENYDAVDAEIELSIYVGKNGFADLISLSFYYNPETSVWEYVESAYDAENGRVIITTNHLSIYSIMYAKDGSQVKDILISQVINRENPLPDLSEVIRVIENPQMSLELDVFDDMKQSEKENVAQGILNKKPGSGYDAASFENTFDGLIDDFVRGQNDSHSNRGSSSTEKQVETVSTAGVVVDSPSVAVPPEALYVVSGGHDVVFGVADQRDLSDGHLKLASRVYSLAREGNVQNVTRIAVAYDDALVTDESRLSVFVLDEDTGTWKSIGGIVDVANNLVYVDICDDCEFAVMENRVEFKDIDNHWAETAIKVLASRQIFSAEAEAFNPDAEFTRAEVADAIVRLAGFDRVDIPSQFADVDETAWYAQSVATARAKSIIAGVGSNTFEPDRTVSRQEIATIAMNLYKFVTGEDTDIDTGVVDVFNDADQIQSYAYSNVHTARSLGIVDGRLGNTYDPQGMTSKAEGAMILYHLLQALGLM